MRLFVLAALCTVLAVAAPNYECEDALELEVDGTPMPYSLNGAPAVPAGTLVFHDYNVDLSGDELTTLFFTFTAESNAMYTVASCDANFHVGMSVYAGAPADVCAGPSNLTPVEVLDWETDQTSSTYWQALSADTEVLGEGLHCGQPGRGMIGHFNADAGQQYTVLLWNFEFSSASNSGSLPDLSATTIGSGAELGNNNIGNGLGWGSIWVKEFSNRRDSADNAQCINAEVVSVPSEWIADFSKGGVSTYWGIDDEDLELDLWYLIETGTQNGWLEATFAGSGNVEVTLFDVTGALDAPLNEADLLVACAAAETNSGGITQNTNTYHPHFMGHNGHFFTTDDDGGEYVHTAMFGGGEADSDDPFYFESNKYYLMRVGWDTQWDRDDDTVSNFFGAGNEFPQYFRQAVPNLNTHFKLVGLWEGADSAARPYPIPDNQDCYEADELPFGRTTEISLAGAGGGFEASSPWDDDDDEAIMFYYFEKPYDQPMVVDLCDTDITISNLIAYCGDDSYSIGDFCDDNNDDSYYANDEDHVCGQNTEGRFLTIYDNSDRCMLAIAAEVPYDGNNRFQLGESAKARVSLIGPPIGDNCFRPISIGVGESVPFTLWNAAPRPWYTDDDSGDYESLQCNGGDDMDDDVASQPDVWFEFEAPSDGVYTFDTCNNFPSAWGEYRLALGVYPAIDEVCNDVYSNAVPCSSAREGFGYNTDTQDNVYGMCGRYSSDFQDSAFSGGSFDWVQAGTGLSLSLGERQKVLIQVFGETAHDDDVQYEQLVTGVLQNFLTVTQEKSTSTLGCASYGADDVQLFCGAGIPAGCRAEHNPLSGAGGGCACFCDASCVEFGDCCADYCATCASAGQEHLEACGLAVGDPHVRGYHGDQFEVLGTANSVYNLLTDANVHVNALFEPSCTASAHRTANIMSEIGVLFGSHRIHWVAGERTATLDGSAMLASHGVYALSQLDDEDLAHVSISADGKLSFESTDYSVTLTARMNRCGQWVSDVSIQFRNKRAMPHGLLGQTETPQGERNTARVPLPGFSQHQGEGFIEGRVQDYRVHGEDLFGTEFRFNRFGEERRMRDLDSRDTGNRSRAAHGLEHAHLRAALKDALRKSGRQA